MNLVIISFLGVRLESATTTEGQQKAIAMAAEILNGPSCIWGRYGVSFKDTIYKLAFAAFVYMYGLRETIVLLPANRSG